jgi:hypothetical protein
MEAKALPMRKLDPRRMLEAIQFSEQLCDPHLWLRQADELLAAARVLENEIKAQWTEIVVEDRHIVRTSGRIAVHAPYFLLVAYAVENFFKGLLVHRHRDELRGRLLPSLPKYLNEHDLITLAKRVGFTTALADQDLLTRLSRNSIWAGRYPVPTGPDGSRALKQYMDGRVYLIAVFYPNDVDRLHELLDRLRAYVVAELAEGAA